MVGQWMRLDDQPMFQEATKKGSGMTNAGNRMQIGRLRKPGQRATLAREQVHRVAEGELRAQQHRRMNSKIGAAFPAALGHDDCMD